MTTPEPELHKPLGILNRAFLLNHPGAAARTLETLPVDETASLLEAQDEHIAASVLGRLTPGIADQVLLTLSEPVAAELINDLDAGTAVAMLSRIPDEKREALLEYMSTVSAKEFRQLLDYPANTVGRLMSSQVIAFNRHSTVQQTLEQLRSHPPDSLDHLFVLNDDMTLAGQVSLQNLLLARQETRLEQLSAPVVHYLGVLDPTEEVAELLDTHQVEVVPVTDINLRLAGVVKSQGLMNALREDLMSDMATMVGASKDERALSGPLFSVRKRLPWLQINLLTAFLAAAVVGMFEDTIARFTALAILLPIAAGQSGNAGAQALAVTMRGLTLREITMKHWLQVMTKEFGAGFLNGCGIAITCSLGVYVWSRSVGLALVMALAMIISMTIAGIAGALVPIGLKRFGLDPAQSSSIVLTTITDIAGFMSFLGIATLLSGMLVAG